jgi:hypothetical protein
MAILDQQITDRYAIYNGDCMEVLPTLPAGKIHFSVYSPPFAGLYNYSSDDRDMSNCSSYEQFMEHYGFLVAELSRVTMAGRLSAVHVMDVTTGDHLRDFPGDVIRMHEQHGFIYHDRHCIWKDPLRVAIRTRSKGLMHCQIVKDATQCRTALPDYILVFRKKGENPLPVEHPLGLQTYAGSRPVPEGLEKFKNWNNPQTNKRAHWIWQQYASAFWHDIRVGRVLPYREARESEDEKHVHPLQLDVIDRCVSLWTNPGETVLTPFMGVGSEVYGAVTAGRRGVGVELKASYYRQARHNMEAISDDQIVQEGLGLEFAAAE